MKRHEDRLEELRSLRIDIEDDTRDRHLHRISAELAAQQSSRRFRWPLVVVTGLIAVGPIAGVASQEALPGGPLYPVKVIIEGVIGVIDDDVVATHRVEEVAQLVDRNTQDALIERHIGVARDALAEIDAPELEQDLDLAVDRWHASHAATDADAPSNPPPSDRPTDRPKDRPGPSTEPSANPVTTTSQVRDEPPASGDTQTTSTTSAGDDRLRDGVRDAP